MPSRPIVALILAFWLGVTGWFVSVDLWPRWFPKGPPFRVDLDVELSAQLPPIRWDVYWRNEKAGILQSGVTYFKEDDTFELHSRIIRLEIPLPSKELPLLKLSIEDWRSGTRVDRLGDLRGVTAKGVMKVDLLLAKEALKLDGDMKAVMRDGILVGEYKLFSSIGNASGDLEPVKGSGRSVFNPMLPIDRISGLTAETRMWSVVLDDTTALMLSATMSKLAEKFELPPGVVPPTPAPKTLTARVTGPKNLQWKGQAESCLVIEYEDDRREVVARTWVAVEDGRVLRQEAFLMRESLALQRIR